MSLIVAVGLGISGAYFAAALASVISTVVLTAIR